MLLLDPRLPDLPASTICARVKEIDPQIHIVILTAHPEEMAVRGCVEAGASGCLFKDTGEQRLMGALMQVVNGREVFDPRVAGARLRRSAVDQPRLTEREQQVLSLIARGLNTQEIGDQLDLSPNTIKSHTRALFTKLDAHNGYRRWRWPSSGGSCEGTPAGRAAGPAGGRRGGRRVRRRRHAHRGRHHHGAPQRKPPSAAELAEREAARRYAAVAEAWNPRVDAAWGDVRATCRSSLWRQCAVALREYATVNSATAQRVARIDMPADAAAQRDAMVLSMNRATQTARTLAGNLADGRPAPIDTTHMREISGAITDTGGHADLLRARLGLPPP